MVAGRNAAGAFSNHLMVTLKRQGRSVLTAPAILVVDDEAMITAMLDLELADAGYAVRVANTGHEAMAALDDSGQSFTAVITDINMGDSPDGWTVARHGREANPDLPVIYMTGAAAAEWPAHGVPRSILVAKPFVVSQIVTALATLLNKASP